jgi:WD40 repeat protein
MMAIARTQGATTSPVRAPLVPTASATAHAAQSIALIGHTAAVSHLSWSPDGSWLASGAGSFGAHDFGIRLWRPDGSLAHVLNGHTQFVTGLAWSPDGKTLASSSWDESIRLWNADGTLLRFLDGHAGQTFAVAWSPDGKILASDSIETVLPPTVQRWNSAGQIVKTLHTSYSGGKFYNLAWSPNGRFLLGGATDYKLWDANGVQVGEAAGFEQCTPARGMAWSPDSRLWAIGNESGSV